MGLRNMQTKFSLGARFRRKGRVPDPLGLAGPRNTYIFDLVRDPVKFS
jgi:hypothetical protein